MEKGCHLDLLPHNQLRMRHRLWGDERKLQCSSRQRAPPTRISFSGNAGKVRHQRLDSRDSNSDSSNASSASVSALNLAFGSTKLGEESPPKHKEDVPMPTDYLSLKVSELKPLLTFCHK